MNEPYDEIWADRIDDYLDERLDAETRRRFEEAMAGDAGLSDLVQKERVLREALWRARALDLKEKLGAWQNETPPPASPFRFKWIWVIAGVAALALLAYFAPKLGLKKDAPGDSLPVFNRDSVTQKQAVPDRMDERQPAEKDKEQATTAQRPQKGLYAAQIRQRALSGYRPPLVTATRRTMQKDSIAVLDKYSEAARAYQAKDYAGALGWVRQADTSRAETRQLYAHVLFQLGQYEAAAEVFQSLKNVNPFGLDAQWNLLMCYKALYPRKEEEYERAAAPVRTNQRHPLHAGLVKFEAGLSKIPR